ncbi:hypothetical protein H6A66_06950 [Bacteroides caecigallinarum]|uniref:BACON domain-containing protein n=1 Tax=Bacteroides caecigallinarum TaxID=1411144 RepID=UPI001957C1BA|nr:BACON domain-containing protein [Bacteroides caecigallinarum]MBM6864907.1 hypothetical protein [Bacteroides caecigallinarum]
MKKIYLNISRTFKCLFFCFFLGSCQEYSIDSQDVAQYEFTIDAKDNYIFTSDAESSSFNISSSSEWSISSNQNWCNVSPTSSSFSSLIENIVISVSENQGWQEREAVITIKVKGFEEDKVINVKQAGKDGFVVTPYSGTISQEGGECEFYIAANKSWNITNISEGLIIEKLNGEGSTNGKLETIKIQVKPNPGITRELYFTVKNDTKAETFSIKQNGIVFALENPGQENIVLKKDEYSSIVKINSNTEWNVINENDWITCSKNSNSELQLTYIPNKLFVQRSGKISLKCDIIDQPLEINVTQPCIYDITEHSSISQNGETGYITVTGNSTSASNPRLNLFKSKPYSFNLADVTIEFEDIKITSDNGALFFNFDGTNGNRVTFKLSKNSSTCAYVARIAKANGGTEQVAKNISVDYKTLKEIEFKNTEDNGKTYFKLYINGEEKISVEETVQWVTDNIQFGMFIQMQNFGEGDSYVIKSVECDNPIFL